MKIAVCLSGQLRNYKDTFQYFKKFIMDKLNPDIFIYTNKNEDFLSNYNAKNIETQEDVIRNTFNYKQTHSSTNEISLLNQHYKIEKCNQMKIDYENKHNFKYDLVIRCRLDAFFVRDFTEKELIVNQNEILVPWGWDFKCVSTNAETDIFAIGDSKTMDIYSSSFSNLNKYENDVIFHSESIIGYNLFKHGIKVNTYIINFQFHYPDIDINGKSYNIENEINKSNTEYKISPWEGKNYYYPSSKFIK